MVTGGRKRTDILVNNKHGRQLREREREREREGEGEGERERE